MILAAILATMLAGAGGVWYGMGLGRDQLVAEQAKEAKIAADTRELAMQGAAAAIAANKPKNVTIKQEVQREIQTNTIYAECRHSDEQLQRLNAALTGDEAGPAGGGLVPKAGAALGQQLRGDDGQAR